MRFTINIPIDVVEPAGEFQKPEALREMAGAIERSGIHAAFVTDHPAPSAAWLASPQGHEALDPFTALAFVAAATNTLMLHTNLMVLPYRNPFILSKAATTLQQFSGGRLIMGAAVGYARDEFEAVGADPGRRGAVSNEVLETLRMVWSGQAVTKRGSSFNAVNVTQRPIPDTSIPIWIGGCADQAVERAARWGDGWTPFWARRAPEANRYQQSALGSVAEFRDKIAHIHELRAGFGRSGPFDIAIAPPQVLQPGSRDGADAYLDSVASMAELGVSWTMLRIKPASRAAFLDTVQWIGEEVVARLP